MRVALVQCPPWGSLPPLGLASLKPYLEARGHEAPCFDLNIDYCRERLEELLDDAGGSVYARPDPWVSGEFDEWAFEFDGEVHFKSALKERPLPMARWADQVLACDPAVVGFSLQSTNLGVTLQLAQEIGRRDPSVKLVFGGPNVAEAQDGALALQTGVPHVVVEGEGEETLVDLLDAFATGRPLTDVAGIGLLVNGVPTWTERRPLLKDVDALPFPDFGDFDWSLYPNPYEIPIMTSRGCVLNCAFCYETVYWKRFRTQSSERIVAEIEHQLAHHPLRDRAEAEGGRFGMSFADSLVNGHLGGLKRMAEMLIERETGIYWNGQATINTKMDDDFFAKLAASGCSGLSFGLESGSQSVLKSMGKRFQIDEATEFFRRAHRSGIEVVANVMVGFPTETRAEFLQTLRFLARIRTMLHMVNNVSPTAVVGGSRLQQSPEQFGIVPVNIRGWEAREDFRWESKAAGTEKNRQRRLRVLHAWMSLMRIPHQTLGPPRPWRVKLAKYRQARQPAIADPGPAVASPRRKRDRPAPRISPAHARAEVRRLTSSTGQQPLVFSAAEGLVTAIIDSPPWTEAADPRTWPGRRLETIQHALGAALGDDIHTTPTVRKDGMIDVEATVTNPHDHRLGALRIYVFPLSKGGADAQLIAIFPQPAAQASAAATG